VPRQKRRVPHHHAAGFLAKQHRQAIGVDWISIGALTKDVQAVALSMRIEG